MEIRYIRSAANPANQLTAPEVADRLARTIDAMSGRPAEGPPLDVVLELAPLYPGQKPRRFAERRRRPLFGTLL